MNHKVSLRKGAGRFPVLAALIIFLKALSPNEEYDVLITKQKKQRTNKQNSAFHKYFSMLAETLNDAGLDMRKLLKEGVDIPWSESTVKEQLWRPIQKAMTGKESTTELEPIEVSKIYDVLNKNLGEKQGIHVPFPSNDERGVNNE